MFAIAFVMSLLGWMLNGTDFDGRKVNVEVTDQKEGQHGGGEKRHGGKEGGNSRPMRGERGGRRDNRYGREESRSYSEKKGKKGSGKVRGAAAAKPSREERGYTSARGPKGAAEWAKFFEGQVESQPFYENFKKKKK